ncbi:MAG TPA: serine/threonine protein kinase, partial [Steroidobacteraceae bacterium]|nr:serine/threonine protein kinase [Steroidobacteraceae bacterium]
MTDSSHPYSALTPDCTLDALDSTGLRADGRLLALNSYENRVYQMGVEDAAAPVVVKFYRPGRWSDAAILEEHGFTLDLAAREIPVVAPLVLNGATLHVHAGFRFAVYPKQGGRTPEFDRAGTLQRMGRFLGRIHAVGADQDFAERRTLDLA